MIPIGHLHALVRYPVKSMAGIAMDSAVLGWHGLEGDRRFAFRRLSDHSHFPWLTASRLPELLLYQPEGFEEKNGGLVPSRVRTPEGQVFPLGSFELQSQIGEKLGAPVELMNIRHGIFDDASVSVINLPTVAAICREAELDADMRRFRPNIVIDTEGAEPFQEDTWLGGRLVFGDRETGPMISITMRDLRCMMINLDPDTAKQNPRMMKAAVQLNDNNAGVYATVVRRGELRVGDKVSLILEG